MPNERSADDARLELFFEAARADAPEPDLALLNRIAAQGEAMQPSRRVARRGSVGSGGMRRFLSAIGGWPGVAGLAAASAAGIWIGVADPGGIAGYAVVGQETATYDLTDLMPGYGGPESEETQG